MKKLLKIGCLIVLIGFGLIIFIGIFVSENNSETEHKSTSNITTVDNYYLDALEALKTKDFNQANLYLLEIKKVDSTFYKIDSLRAEIKSIHIDAKKIVDDELKSLESLTYKDYDEFKGITWVYPKSYKGTYGNRVYSYFGIKNEKPFIPRLVVKYYGDDWLFWKQCLFLIDGEPANHYITKLPNRDHSGGSVWEISDEEITASTQALLKQIFSAKEVKYRLTGKYYKDFNLNKNRINDIENILKYYYLLENKSKLDNFKLN